MKTIILAALAATVAATPLIATGATAQTRQTTVVREQPNGRTVTTTRTTTANRGYRSWRTGDRFDHTRAENFRRLDDWRARRLAPPPRGAYWARSGRDAVLVRPNGTIVSVRTRVF